jgi:amphi-Trp domain-containing protein
MGTVIPEKTYRASLGEPVGSAIGVVVALIFLEHMTEGQADIPDQLIPSDGGRDMRDISILLSRLPDFLKRAFCRYYRSLEREKSWQPVKRSLKHRPHSRRSITPTLARLFRKAAARRVKPRRQKFYSYPRESFSTTFPVSRLLMGNHREQIKEESIMKNELNFEANLELQRAISYLEEVASSLKDGKLVVERAQDFVVLEPTHLVQMELEASAEEERGKFKFKLSWEKPLEFDLRISSTEPEKAPEEKPEKEEEEDEEQEEKF